MFLTKLSSVFGVPRKGCFVIPFQVVFWCFNLPSWWSWSTASFFVFILAFNIGCVYQTRYFHNEDFFSSMTRKIILLLWKKYLANGVSEVYRSVEGVSVIPRAKLYVQWKRDEVIKVCVWICCFLINMGRVQLSSCGLLAPREDVCLLLSGFDLVFCLTGTVSRFPFLQGWLEYEGPQHKVQSTHISFLALKRASSANGALKR